MLRFTTVFFMISLLVAASTTSSARVESSIDDYIENAYIPFHKIPGLGLAIVKDNGDTINIVKSYGLRNVEDGLTADGNTIYAIGSISKTFTSVLAVKTLSEKFPTLPKFGIDVPIVELFPSYNFTMRDRFRTESTTFRDLLSHKMCTMPTQLTLGAEVYTSKQDLAYRQRYAVEICSFRTAWVYNNGVIELAADIVAELANTTFNDMLHDFFREVGMTSSTMILLNEDYNAFPNMSRAYYKEDGIIKRHNPLLLNRLAFFAGAGGILSTPNDMKTFMMFLMNKGKVGNQQIVREDAILLMTESSNLVMAGAGKFGPNDPYELIYSHGLGVINAIQDGWEKGWHDGYIPPYSSLMTFYPALKLGVFITTNGPGQFHPSLGHQLLHLEIYNLIMNGTTYNSSAAHELLTETSEKIVKESTPKSAPIHEKNPKVEAEDIVGLYGSGLEGEFVISAAPNATDENIFIAYGKWGTGNLIRQTDSVFLIQFTSDIVQDDFTYEGGYTALYLGLSGNDTAAIYAEGSSQLIFKKDQTLDKLPVIPWAPGSCSRSV